MTVNTSSVPTNTTVALTDTQMILTTSFFSFVIVVGLTGNSLVVTRLVRFREMTTPCNLLIANICAADLGVCLLAAPLRIIEIYRGWIFGDVLCYILTPLQDVFVVVSVVTQTVIALERHRAIVTPFKPKITVKRVKMVVPVIWIACYVTSGVSMLVFLKNTFSVPHGYYICEPVFPSSASRIAYEMYLVGLFITLPLLLQSVSYVNAIRTLRAKNQMQSIYNARDQSISMKRLCRDRIRQKKRLVRMLIVLMLVFQVCYLPRGVIMLIYEFSPETTARPGFSYVNTTTLAMFYLKHVINPIILAAMSEDFRSGCPICRG